MQAPPPGFQQQQAPPGWQPPPPNTIVWLFEVEPGQWAPFAPEDSQLIEGEHAKGVPQVQVKLRNIDYLLDFQNMSRRNVQTGSERKMQRTTFGEMKNINMVQGGPPPGAGQGGQPPMAPIEGVCWLFCDETGNYMRLTNEDSDAIEALFKSNAPVGNIELRGVQYEMNFQTWKRKNLGTGSERAIRRVDPKSLPPYLPAEKGVMWVLKDDAGNWVPYAPPDSAIIEEAYGKNTSPASVTLLNGQANYEINFTAMTTKNTVSGSERTIRRLQDGKVIPAV
eukprot:TRINITY_DN114203_c0_g1_i1.p1 TRINITY_DN114203_c0_g1~~TRINITY_DN114203_c0_g1_i1.p1  ORF type:complete len:280 (+),score=29.44 TRINITY_DN114203_c0_g1_i1:42-881(+)